MSSFIWNRPLWAFVWTEGMTAELYELLTPESPFREPRLPVRL